MSSDADIINVNSVNIILVKLKFIMELKEAILCQNFKCVKYGAIVLALLNLVFQLIIITRRNKKISRLARRLELFWCHTLLLLSTVNCISFMRKMTP